MKPLETPSGESNTKLTVASRKSQFMVRFKLENRAMQRGDPKIGKAKVTAGTIKETGEQIVLKQWRRDASNVDAALRELWRQEIRQLHRLAGSPGAREYMVSQIDSAEDDEGFYLVLSPGQRLPIEALKQRVTEFHWLRQPRNPSSRQKIWANLARVAAGLDILHTQGLLHRNLDLWSIYSAGGEEPDFQLSGFEWSVRLSGVASRGATKLSIDGTVYSYLEDWRNFSRLACLLFEVDPRSLLKPAKQRENSDPVQHLSPQERDLLAGLLRSDPLSRVDGEWVGQKIEDILQSLRTVATGKHNTLYLSLNFSNGRLGNAIYDVSDGDIDPSDIDGATEFVRRDISDEPLLVAANIPNSSGVRYLLIGRALVYLLNPYRPTQRGEPTWAIAYSDNITVRPTQREIVGQQFLSFADIQILPFNQAARRLAVIQGRTLYWDQQVNRSEIAPRDDRSTQKFRGLVLLQQIEALVSAANIFPVSVTNVENLSEQVRIVIKSRKDTGRDELSSVLSLKAPAVRLAEIFSDEQLSPDGTWKISDRGVLGNYDDETAKWRFVETQEEEGQFSVIFEGPGPAPTSTHLFLRKDDYIGHEALLRRRTRSLRALKEHVELLEMLAEPRKLVRKTQEVVVENEYFAQLDESKQSALQGMWTVLPLFLVQGPPGVGKTRLVTELVRRTLDEDESARILLTAQSHHAVDHLLDEVRKVLGPGNSEKRAPLLVRTRPKDNDGGDDFLDVRQQAKSIVERFGKSSLAKKAPKKLLQKLRELEKLYTAASPDTKSARRGDRSFEALILRSANVVFASTNSGDLERLIDERTQFDWSVVEEAAKATGVEILAPLLLSHRRLMIGDHEQLPPYGEQQMRKLLSQPSKVRDALELAKPMISSQLREISDEELSSALEPEQFQTICGEAGSVLNLFESFVQDEIDDQDRKTFKSRISIAHRLTFQHRMHPAIAEIVSKSFYGGELLTDPGCVSSFEKNEPPFEITDVTRMPPAPIVVVDMPYGQATHNTANSERKPNYHNPDELEAVIDVLEQLDAKPESSKKPTLAILSPYRQQVKRLNARIKKEMGGRLAKLSGFHIEGDQESLTGTVDSFQGSEADVVVLSLVRNNHHSGKRALGFLADARRMNVLLSRAKWKLIIVCSTDFLRRRLPTGPLSKTDDLYFLKQIFATLDDLQKRKDVHGNALAEIVSVEKIMKGRRK
jgi:hypothetical protein